MQRWVFFLSVLFFARFAFGQNSSGPYGREFNLQTGPTLPDQIKGVTEIQPTWGFFYKIPMAGAGLEFGLLDSHANGVDFATATVRGRFDVPIDRFLTAVAFIGPDLNYYNEAGQSDRMAIVGFHAGGGVMYQVIDTLWLRADMKFAVNPGDSLYFGFGVSFRSSDSGGAN